MKASFGICGGSIILICAIAQSAAATDSRYVLAAPLQQYMMPKSAEIALARSAAPRSISANASIMVLGWKGYTTVVKGKNGFLCLVERSWGAATTDPEFWNPRVRAPICFNPPAARTLAPVYLTKSKLVLSGGSREDIARAIAMDFSKGALPTLAPGAMSYMMSTRQYLGDQTKRWHPHLMFFVSGNAAKSWGANLPGSPVIAANDPEERATVFLVWVGHWSNGSPAP